MKHFLLPFLLSVADVQAATSYVSTSGNDSNSGSSASPFRTITHAYSTAKAGDTILVGSGIYTDYTTGWGLHFNSVGTASSPITIRSQVRDGAIIDGQNASTRNQAIYLDGSYNVIDGFEIRNGPNGGIAIYGNGNKILNCHIHNNGTPASTSTNGKDGIYSDPATHDNYYGANYVHDNGRTGGSNLDHGFYLCGQNETMVNNISFHNDASGLQIAGYSTINGMKIYNNVMAWNGTSGIILWMSLGGVDIKNNIIYQNGHYGIGSVAATGGGVVVDHNISIGNGLANYFLSGFAYTQGISIPGDPAFVSDALAGFDPHLTANSPAVNSGVNLSPVFTTDLAGALRPVTGAWDLGAYVFGSTVQPPFSPTNLHVVQ